MTLVSPDAPEPPPAAAASGAAASAASQNVGHAPIGNVGHAPIGNVGRPTFPTAPAGDAPELVSMRALLDLFAAEADALHTAAQENRPRGPLTGLPTLDEAIGGALLPGVHVVLGVPGVGKTAFALQIAATCQCPALYVTCEMPPLELLRRMAARVTQTYLGKFKTGELRPEIAIGYAVRAARSAPDLAFLDATRAWADFASIVTGAQAVRDAAANRGTMDATPAGSGGRGGAAAAAQHLLIVVDSLHSWAEGAAAAGGLGEYDRLAEHLQALKRISAHFACPVLVVSERNRQSMERGGLSGGAGHRGIEYGAETVFDLDLDAALKNLPSPNMGTATSGEATDIVLQIQKNRNGVRGRRIALRFHGATQTYREE